MKTVVIFFIALLSGCSSSEPTAAPLSITAPALALEYQLDTKEADKRYKGQRLRVAGEVDSPPSGEIVVLKGDAFRVACSMRREYSIEAKKLKRGQKVVIEGECRGKTVAVLLTACVLK